MIETYRPIHKKAAPTLPATASRRHLLEFDGDSDLTTGTGGGSWRFRHRILQEYFAGRWVEPEGEPAS